MPQIGIHCVAINESIPNRIFMGIIHKQLSFSFTSALGTQMFYFNSILMNVFKRIYILHPDSLKHFY